MKLPQNRRNLIAAAVAATAVLITALSMLASRERPLAPTQSAAEPAPVAVAKKPDTTGEFIWHEVRESAPTTEFQDSAGATMTLQAFAGKVLVVNFWATWCAPCVEELPTLDALQAQLGGDGFRVLAIAQDREGAKVVTPFVDKNGYKNLPIYLEPLARFARDAKLRGLPTTLIIDRQGREAGRLEGTIDWTSPDVIARLNRLMAEAG